MKNGITLYPRTYTYRRSSLGQPANPDESHTLYRPQFSEATETFVAYAVFVTQGKDGLNVQFYQLSEVGDPILVKLVQNVLEIDNGVIVSDSEASHE